MNLESIVSNLQVKKGDIITIVKWLSHPDRSWVGDIMEVTAVDEPFIRVWIPKQKIHYTLNLEDVEIQPAHPDFIAAIEKENKLMNYEKADKLQALCEIILPRLGRPDIRVSDIQYWESIDGEHGWSIHLTSDEAEIPESIIPDLLYRLKIDAPTITPIEVRIF